METERRVIFAEPIDLDSQDEQDENEEAAAVGSDEDIGEDLPVQKKRKFDDDEMRAAKQELMLTRNFRLEREFGPALTAGSILLMKDGKHAIGLRDDKLTLFCVDSAKVVGTIEEENESVIAFALSPNQ